MQITVPNELRKREQFAISLRKQKKAELLQEKRTHLLTKQKESNQRYEALFGEIAQTKNASPVIDLKSANDLASSAQRLMNDLDQAIDNEYFDDMEFLAAEAAR